MKNYSFGLIAVLFALFSAFAFKPAFDTFRFDGASSNPNHRVNPAMYTKTSPSCGSTDVTLCSITTASNGDLPVIDEITTPDLFDALYNGGLSVPDFSYPAIEGKNP